MGVTSKLFFWKWFNIHTSSFEGVDGILIPGGFGDRGIEGKISSSQYARENNIPFFGICLGMQCAVIDYARHECNMKAANSTEFNKRTKFITSN